MADTISLPEDVNTSDPVTWKPVRELADAISKLYADKEIFGLDKLETKDTPSKPATIISEWSTRITDTFANVCTNDSSIDGCVYLTEDVTAPFRLDKLGESGDLAPKCIAFEFAYDIDAYNAYLEGSKLPILTTQYLIYYELLSNRNSGHIAITSFNIAEELTAEELTAEERVSLNNTTVCNLIESRRDKIKKFWKPKDEGTEEDTYAESPEIAGELYLKIKDPAGSECSTVTRVAFAGLNKNGNGNSGKTKDVSKVYGYIGDTRKFLTEGKGGWMRDDEGIAVTLTGISMNRIWGDPVSEQGFLPEADDENYSTYEAPPIGCCSLCTWPSIGLEGGGGSNTFFNPNILKNYINWADWRAEYQKELTSEDINNSRNKNVDDDEVKAHEGRFPCHLGENKPANEGTSYNYDSYAPSYTTYFQRWLHVSDNVYVRVAPLKFNGSSIGKHAYLVVPITIGVVLEPISYQPAIRKRWYDMIYYSLRNIAGYKHYNHATGDTKIIGVTWNTTNDSTNTTIKSIDVEKYLNPCASNGNLDDKCNCNTCKFERWKYLNLGGEGWETNDSDTDPFVGTPKDFEDYNAPELKNCAQMWLWDEDRYKSIKTKVEAADADYLFPELYFEKLICYKNSSIFGANDGGFKMKEETTSDTACGCTLCDEHATETAYKLPWEGGGNNQTCEDGGNYLTHAETFNKLNYLAKFILDYKLPETTTRALDKLEIGNCFSYATAGGGNIKFTGAAPKITIHTSQGLVRRCITKDGTTYILPIVAPWYRTLSSNETFEINKEGTSASIATNEEAYGYNAYVWKAFDPGGLQENQNKDLKIIFTHHNPARVCASPTLIDIDKPYIKKNSDIVCENPLHINSECKYEDNMNGWGFDAWSDSRTKTPICYKCLYNPNEKHTCGDAASNQGQELWAEIMWWALQSPEKSVYNIRGEAREKTSEEEGESIAWISPTCAGAIPMWSRDNSETSIGTIDIYLAPVPKSRGGANHSNMARYLGSCHFSIECSGEKEYLENPNCTPEYITYCDDAAKTVTGINTALNTSEQVVTYTDTFGVSSSSSVITTKITNPPTAEKNYLEAEITIPSDLLINKSAGSTKVYDDQRQQYIILAHRASHTHINSWLADSDSNEVNLTEDNKLKTWATEYASACRYAAFNTNFAFERTPQSST